MFDEIPGNLQAANERYNCQVSERGLAELVLEGSHRSSLDVVPVARSPVFVAVKAEATYSHSLGDMWLLRDVSNVVD
jgi:hypothetical protein